MEPVANSLLIVSGVLAITSPSIRITVSNLIFSNAEKYSFLLSMTHWVIP